MSFFKKKKDVNYSPLGDNGYHIKADIDGERFDIIAYRYPVETRVDTKAGVAVSPEGAKVEGQREKEDYSSWDAVVKTQKYGFLPIKKWKKITEEVSGTLSVVTGSDVKTGDINFYTSAPVSKITKCPKCSTPILINLGVCQVCGAKLD
jgi:hypothetical protein